MKIIQIDSSKLSQMQELGRGACSTVYKYSEDLVIKVLNEKGIDLHNEDEFSKIIEIENSTCVFPKDRVEIDGKFQGYTMDYVQGEPLHERIRIMDIDTLILAIKEVESDLMQLSSEKVLFQDLNQGGIMWDNIKCKIKIIDTDFFQKNEEIEPEQCYSANMEAFNSMIEMELGILNGQGTRLSEYLHNNSEFSKVYKKYMIYPLKGMNMSVTELITKAIEIFENEFNVKLHSIEEMQKFIGKQNKIYNLKEVPVFEPPKENREETGKQSKIGIKQKIANFLADKTLLRRISFIDKFVLNQQNLLLESSQSEKNIKTEHDIFVSKISDIGKYKDMTLGEQIKGVIKDTIETTGEQFKNDIERRKKIESQSMADEGKIEQMKKKMEAGR